MPYAENGRVSQDAIAGGITISQAQYAAAIAGMMSGKVVSVVNGSLVVELPPPIDPGPGPEPEPRLPDLQPYQFKAMLALSGKQGDLDAFIEALPEPGRTVAKAKLEYSLVFKRDNELVLGAQAGMGLTDDELDELWLQAYWIQ